MSYPPTTPTSSPAQEAEIRRLLESLRSTQATSSDSCDPCRSAKVKCSRGATCERCAKLELDCTRHHRLVRRGPPTKKQRVEFEKSGLPYRTFRDRLAERRQSKSGASSERERERESAQPRLARSRSTPSGSHTKGSRRASIDVGEGEADAGEARGVADASTPALSAASTDSMQSGSFMLDDFAEYSLFGTTLDSFNVLQDAAYAPSLHFAAPFPPTAYAESTFARDQLMKPEAVESWQQQQVFQWDAGVDPGMEAVDPAPFSAYHFSQAPQYMPQETSLSPTRPASVEPPSANLPSNWLKQTRRSYPALFRQPNC